MNTKVVEDFRREHRESSVEYWTHYNIQIFGWHNSFCCQSLIKTKKINQQTHTQKKTQVKQLEDIKKLMRLESGIIDATGRSHFVLVLRDFQTKQNKSTI